MLWIKAFHLIFVVTWFSGLFYLPRLFVYHAQALDSISQNRFKIMEKKLYYVITLPSAVLATLWGVLLMSYNFPVYLRFPWMHVKLALVVLLWAYTLICGKYVIDFKNNKNQHGSMFYRFFNEIPALLLISIIIMVVVKPI